MNIRVCLNICKFKYMYVLKCTDQHLWYTRSNSKLSTIRCLLLWWEKILTIRIDVEVLSTLILYCTIACKVEQWLHVTASSLCCYMWAYIVTVCVSIQSCWCNQSYCMSPAFESYIIECDPVFYFSLTGLCHGTWTHM